MNSVIVYLLALPRGPTHQKGIRIKYRLIVTAMNGFGKGYLGGDRKELLAKIIFNFKKLRPLSGGNSASTWHKRLTSPYGQTF